ncbi:MAG: hypothetical protein NVS3B1_12750 [Marmoricola sp.]
MFFESDSIEGTITVTFEDMDSEPQAFIHTLRTALPDGDRDKAVAEGVADRVERDCVGPKAEDWVDIHLETEGDAVSASLERSDHPLAQEFIAIQAEVEMVASDEDYL